MPGAETWEQTPGTRARQSVEAFCADPYRLTTVVAHDGRKATAWWSRYRFAGERGEFWRRVGDYAEHVGPARDEAHARELAGGAA